jgi:pullulanase/glycogen debranching enzyme
MPQDMRAICGAAYQFQEFSKQNQQVPEVVSATSSPFLSKSYLLLNGYIYDKQKQRSPNYVHHHDSVELRDQLMLQVQHNKHNDHHREQIRLCGKVELNDDKEFLQIDLI